MRSNEKIYITKDRRLENLVLSVSSTLITRRGSSIYCRLCGRGPLTRRGAYLHLLRVHEQDIGKILREELIRITEQE